MNRALTILALVIALFATFAPTTAAAAPQMPLLVVCVELSDGRTYRCRLDNNIELYAKFGTTREMPATGFPKALTLNGKRSAPEGWTMTDSAGRSWTGHYWHPGPA